MIDAVLCNPCLGPTLGMPLELESFVIRFEGPPDVLDATARIHDSFDHALALGRDPFRSSGLLLDRHPICRIVNEEAADPAPSGDELMEILRLLPPENVANSRLREELFRVARVLKLHNQRLVPYEEAERLRDLSFSSLQEGLPQSVAHFEAEVRQRLVQPFGDRGARIAFAFARRIPEIYLSLAHWTEPVTAAKLAPLPSPLQARLTRIARWVRQEKGWEPGPNDECGYFPRRYYRDYVERLWVLVALRSFGRDSFLTRVASRFPTVYEAAHAFEKFIVGQGWARDRSTLMATLEDMIEGREPPATKAPHGFLWDLFFLLYQQTRTCIVGILDRHSWATFDEIVRLTKARHLESAMSARDGWAEGTSIPLWAEISENVVFTSEEMIRVFLADLVRREEAIRTENGYRINENWCRRLVGESLPALSFYEEQRLFREFLKTYLAATGA